MSKIKGSRRFQGEKATIFEIRLNKSIKNTDEIKSNTKLLKNQTREFIKFN